MRVREKCCGLLVRGVLAGLLFSGCVGAPKKVVVPEYRPMKEPPVEEVKKEQKDEETRLKNVPEVLLHSSLHTDDTYHKGPEERQPASIEEDVPSKEEGDASQQHAGVLKLRPPEKEYLMERLRGYEQALSSWNQLAARMVGYDAGLTWPSRWHECVQGLEYMVFGYRREIATLSEAGNAGRVVGRNPWDMVTRDVQYLESGCRLVLQQGEELLDEIAGQDKRGNGAALTALMRQFMKRQEYERVVSAYTNAQAMPANDDDADDATHVLCAEALVRLGRLDQALKILRRIYSNGTIDIDVHNASMDDLQIMRRYADLLFLSGASKEARDVYTRLDTIHGELEEEDRWVVGQLHFMNDYAPSSQEYRSYMRLVDKMIRYDGRGIPQEFREQYESILAQDVDFGLKSHARRVMQIVDKKARLWGRKKLSEVDFLAQEKEFAAARNVVHSLTGLPDDLVGEREKLEKTMNALEREDRQVQRFEDQEVLAVRWQEALDLLESSRYEKALAAFERFVGTPYEEKAKVQRDKAVGLITVQLRKEAADLFVQARRQRDPIEQEKMMLGSRDMLRLILSQYPDAEIVPKVEQNLKAVEEQLMTLNKQARRPGEDIL